MASSEVRYAVIIGVSDYAPGEQLPSIPFARNDAIRLRDILCDKCNFKRDHVKLFAATNDAEYPTYASILSGVERVSKVAQPDDMVLVYFAGHGIEASRTPYLLTADTRMNVVRETAIDINVFNSFLEKSKAKCIIRIFDACRKPFSVSRGATGRMTYVLEEALIAAGTGWATLSSCSSGEASFETGEFEQGVFSFYVCEGLSGEAANEEGIVTLEALVDYVRISVRNWSKDQSQVQTPHFQMDISGVTELSQVPVPIPANVVVEPDHPLSELSTGLQSHLASIATDARNLSFTDESGLQSFAMLVMSHVSDFVHSATLPSVVVTKDVSEDGELKNANDRAWHNFTKAVTKYGIGPEFSHNTVAAEVSFTSQEVIVPESRVVLAAVRFSYFYWLWYQHFCQTPEQIPAFRPTPPLHTGYFVFKPSAAADPQKTESAVRELLARASADYLEWTKQLHEHIDSRLARFRNEDSIIE